MKSQIVPSQVRWSQYVWTVPSRVNKSIYSLRFTLLYKLSPEGNITLRSYTSQVKRTSLKGSELSALIAKRMIDVTPSPPFSQWGRCIGSLRQYTTKKEYKIPTFAQLKVKSSLFLISSTRRVQLAPFLATYIYLSPLLSSLPSSFLLIIFSTLFLLSLPTLLLLIIIRLPTSFALCSNTTSDFSSFGSG